MLLTLIAEIADGKGSAGPWIETGEGRALLRDWLGETLAQMAERDSKRQSLIDRVRVELQRDGLLPEDPKLADRAIELEVAERVRVSARTNVSRAVSELVKAGLLQRHYQGFAVDHINRGGQRHVVYTLSGDARMLMRRSQPAQRTNQGTQQQLPF